MKGIIIAAGSATRLRPLTEHLPKCMLKINGKPIMQNMIELFRNNGIKDISAIRGWKKENINFPNVAYFENTDFWNNNILHSLMFAREKLEEAAKADEEVVISYSDIWYNDSVLKELLRNKNDMAAVVDTDWRDYYDGRTNHPISEAENIVLDDKKRIVKIGKNIFTESIPKDQQGEFIGLWKFSAKGIEIFLGHFDRLNKTLKMTEPYQNTKEWQKSYITDIFQEMIDKGENVYAALIQKNWKEFDTAQDYLRVNKEVIKESNIIGGN